MYNIAIVSPGILPVPAVKGGAVETLVTYLIEENEVKGKIHFDVYTCKDDVLKEKTYHMTNIIMVTPGVTLRFICKVLNYLKHHIGVGSNISSYNLSLYLKRIWRQYDYILVENSMKTYQVLHLKKACRNKLIYHMHNDIEPESGDKSVERTRLVARTSKIYMTCSDYLRKKVIKIEEAAKIDVLYNCVDLKQFTLDRLFSQDMLKQKYQIKETDIIIMYAGRLEEEKGVGELLHAFKYLMDLKDVKLLLVGCSGFSENGSTPYLKEIESMIKDMKGKIIPTGFVQADMMQEYYGLSDIVVVPSIVEEAFGMVAAEAMAMKRPLIVTKSGGLIEVVDETCAFIIEKDEKLIENMASAMRKLVENKDLRREMAEASFRRLVNKKEFHRCQYFSNFCRLIMEDGEE